MAGTLYLVATPIGNLEDMTYRAIRVLSEADLIAAEDTRNSIRLLTHFEIHTPMTSYHEFNKFDKGEELVELLLQGKNIALITDAGTPGISDPGQEVVRMCIDAGIPVTAVPGACAAVNALVISGQETRRFVFEAFLPSEKKERREVLAQLKDEERTMVLYEAPHHLKKTLGELYETLGDRSLTLLRELTKKHETVLKTTLSEACAYYEANEPRGEYVLVIAGADHKEAVKAEQAMWQESMTIPEHVRYYESTGMDRKEALKAVAKDRGISKRDVYKEMIDH